MVQVIHRAFDLLARLAERPQGLTELAEATGLRKPTLHNILGSLEQVGAVRRISGRRYAVGPKLGELAGRDVWAGLTLLSREVLTGVVEDLQESCNVSVLHRGERRTLVHMMGEQDLIANARFGRSGPLYTAATGRALLAYAEPEQREQLVAKHGWPAAQWDGIESAQKLEAAVEAIRAQGLAILDEPEKQVAMVAAPVHAPSGRVVAALGVAVPKVRFVEDYRERVIERVRSAAAELADQLALAQGASVALPEPRPAA